MKLFKKQKPQGRQPINQAGKPKPAFSYYAGDNKPKKDSVRARQASEQRASLFSRLRLVPTIVAISVILVSVVYSTTLSTSPHVTFAGTDSPYRTSDDYRNGITKVLQSSLFNNSKLTLNTSSTNNAILTAYPELDVASVSLPIIGRRPTVTLHVRQPALILTTSTNAYVIDSAGKVVSEASKILSSSREALLTVQDQSGLEVTVGKQALTSQAVTFITAAQAQLKAKQITIVQATLPTTPNEIDFRLKDIGYFVKTDITGDARLQIGSFIAAKDDGIAPGEYMDVRVEEKVFFK